MEQPNESCHPLSMFQNTVNAIGGRPLKAKPPGITVVNDNIFKSVSALTGYLGMTHTNELALLFKNEEVEDILSRFHTLKQAGFEIPNVKGDSRMQTKALFATIRAQDDNTRAILHIQEMSLADPCFADWDKTQHQFMWACARHSSSTCLQRKSLSHPAITTSPREPLLLSVREIVDVLLPEQRY